MSTLTQGFAVCGLARAICAALAFGAAGESMIPTAAHAGDVSRPAVERRTATFATSSVTHNVSSCLDDGSVGTLRQAVGISLSGDSVDLSGLPVSCSTITLLSGEIKVTQSVLTLIGPATRSLTITSNHNSRILHQTGAAGLLTVAQLTLSNGGYYGYNSDIRGGCIFASGNLKLTAAVVTGCVAYSVYGIAFGGGVYAAGQVSMYFSQLIANSAGTNLYTGARGGAVYANNGLLAFYSALSGNSASSSGSLGGGACVAGSVEFFGSTVDSNQAGIGGGVSGGGTSNTTSFAIQNSTISGNKAAVRSGGVDIFPFAASTPVIIRSSTIALNLAPHSAGVNSAHDVLARSSIIAMNANTAPDGFADLYVQGEGHTLTGDSNLIVTSNLGLADTLTSNPQLTPLTNHGGLTRVHALLASSPAVNHGSNVVNLFYDQRRTGFGREVPVGSPDIGAYERQASDDEIFFGGFD